MKEKIKEAANSYVYEYFRESSSLMKGGLTTGFIEGAEWMHSQYGVSPDTVKEMLEALKEALDQLESFNPESEATFTMRRVGESINKAEQELNTK